jgi:hypothetical protein
VIDARALAGRTFRSLHVRNYRLYFFGQIVSLTGTWMQSVAQAWLVFQLSPAAWLSDSPRRCSSGRCSWAAPGAG